MNVLVVSDSHGKVNKLIQAVEQVHPSYVLHLGDCQRDLEQLRPAFPMLPMDGEPGHCAYGRLCGDILVPLVDIDGALLVLNPGAAGDPLHPTCGILTIENGRADVRTLAL